VWAVITEPVVTSSFLARIPKRTDRALFVAAIGELMSHHNTGCARISRFGRAQCGPKGCPARLASLRSNRRGSAVRAKDCAAYRTWWFA